MNGDVALWNDDVAWMTDQASKYEWENGGRDATHAYLDMVAASRKVESAGQSSAPPASFALRITSLLDTSVALTA